jgi:hypothetical protein
MKNSRVFIKVLLNGAQYSCNLSSFRYKLMAYEYFHARLHENDLIEGKF